MKTPQQARPIIRESVRAQADPKGVVAACAGVPGNIIGTCIGDNGPIPGMWNCRACCALRGAISWQGGGYAVECSKAQKRNRDALRHPGSETQQPR
jgi:hypothetical protein